MRICIVPGSFDPITNGHADVIERAMRQFDQVVVAVLRNPQKQGFFAIPQRLEMIRRCFPQEKVEVCSFDGLLAEFARQKGAVAIVKGLRALTDFEYEFQMASLNRMLNPDVETVFFMTQTQNMYVSSSMVRDIGLLGGNYASLVPAAVFEMIEAAFEQKRTGG